jgi:dipeptidyl aminopeptidase/acylaminoacyl peptidase
LIHLHQFILRFSPEFFTKKVSLSPYIFCAYSGAKLPFEAIFVSHKDSASNPTIVVLHGGPHSVYPSSYSKSLAFLFSQGYNLLVVNYR